MRATILLTVSSAALAWGCGASYEPGTFTDYGRRDEPRLRTLGCVDVVVQPRGAGAMPDAYVAVDYELGNRCAHPVEVALGAARVTVLAGFVEGPAPLFDPRGEVADGVLDGRRYATEALAYETGFANLPTRLCVDVTGVVPGEHAAPVCFRSDGTELDVEAL